jgi:hypothetical protein
MHLAPIDAEPRCYRAYESSMHYLTKGAKVRGLETILARLALLPEQIHSKLQT